jgi:hypothetical protein
MEGFATCPVCNDDVPLLGPDGVVVHLVEIHADSPEACWIKEQLGLLVLEPSG